MIVQNRKYSRILTFLSVSLLISICFVFFTFAQESPENTYEYSLDQIDKAPRIIERILPVYPQSAITQGIKAKVTGTDGLATEIEAVKADPEEALDVFGPPAVEAVKKWRFSPGEIGGEPVTTRVAFNVVFELPSQTNEVTP